MKQFVKALPMETNGIGRVGTLPVLYADIVDVLGEPHATDLDGKVAYYWAIVFPDGTVASIHDYKVCATWNHSALMPAQLRETFTGWSIGGFNRKAADHVHELFQKKLDARPGHPYTTASG